MGKRRGFIVERQSLQQAASYTASNVMIALETLEDRAKAMLDRHISLKGDSECIKPAISQTDAELLCFKRGCRLNAMD